MTTTMTQLFDREIATLLEMAKRHGLSDVEIFAKADTGLSLKAQKGELEAFNRSKSVGVGLRVLKGERVGYAYTENMSADALERALLEAAGNAELVEPAPGSALPADTPLTGQLPELYDATLDTVPVEDKIAFTMALEKAAYDADKRIRTVPYSGYSDGSSFVRIANTRGVDRSYRQNAAFAYSYPIATQGTENKVYMVSQATRRFDELDIQRVAGEAARGAVRRLNAQEIKSGRYPVVFAPRAMAELLSVFSSLFSAKAAQDGKSLLAGQVGQTIASDLIRLVDDPLLATGFASRPFDDEGVPSRPLTLIEKGVFKSFLHNTQTANQEGATSTGHASRGSYKGTLDVAPSNFFLEAGKTPVADLLAGAEPLLLIDDLQGLHAGTNAISGDFSLQAQGYLYRNGEATSVQNFTVAGNFLAMLKEVVAVGDDMEFFPQGAYIGTPSVKIAELAVAGSGT